MALNWNLAGEGPTFAEQLQGFNAGQAQQQQQRQQAARVQAGQQYVGGQRQQAAQTLAGAGDFAAARGVADDVQADQLQSEAAKKKHEAETWIKLAPAIEQAAQRAQAAGQDPNEAAAQAFDQLADVLQVTPEEHQAFRPAIAKDYKTIINAVLGEAKKQIVQSGGWVGSVDPRSGQVETLREAPVDPLLDDREALIQAQAEAARAQVPLREAQAQKALRPPAARGGGGRSGPPKLPAGIVWE